MWEGCGEGEDISIFKCSIKSVVRGKPLDGFNKELCSNLITEKERISSPSCHIFGWPSENWFYLCPIILEDISDDDMVATDKMDKVLRKNSQLLSVM